MKSLYSLLIGIGVGLVLGAAWLLVFWLWGRWGTNLVTSLTTSEQSAPSPLILDLTPIVAGALIFLLGIASVTDHAKRCWASWANCKTISWAAAATCFLFSTAMAVFYFFVAYSMSGFDSFIQ